MSILNGEDIRARINESDYQKKLVVTPLLSETQIGPASIDVRLGSSIVIPRKTYVEKQDVTDPSIVSQVENRLYDRTTLRPQSRFMLHPNQLILGVTFEFLSLPSDLFAVIMSRSSWGRLGLVVATAAAIQPGYHGCLTLELVNLSESPIALYPCLPIGQLVFHTIEAKGAQPSIYHGRYDCPTEAELPKFFSGAAKDTDQELAFWGEPSDRSQPRAVKGSGTV